MNIDLFTQYQTPNETVLDFSKIRAVAEDNLRVIQMKRYAFKKSMARKCETCCYQLPAYFSFYYNVS